MSPNETPTESKVKTVTLTYEPFCDYPRCGEVPEYSIVQWDDIDKFLDMEISITYLCGLHRHYFDKGIGDFR